MIHKVSRRFRRAAHRLVRGTEASPSNHERPATWYNSRYSESAEYHKHYTESVYYPSWSLIVDRLKSRASDSVLDIGCGSGQFGAMLRDGGVSNYLGLDFCDEAISLAKTACPEFTFEAADVFQSRRLEEHGYDTVVSLEFLEHVERDLEVLERIRENTFFIGSVPNFPSDSHVRWFNSEAEVAQRYAPLFSDFRTDCHLLNKSGRCLYIMQGIRR